MTFSNLNQTYKKNQKSKTWKYSVKNHYIFWKIHYYLVCVNVCTKIYIYFDHDPKQEYFKNRNSYQNIVSRQFTAIRLAASTTSMSQELSRMVKNAREENARRGGWVRIFPTAETWPNYGSMLEFSSPNNQILHEHLFPDAARKVPSFR